MRSVRNQKKKNIFNLGKIELFELGEVSTTTQCKVLDRRTVTLHLRNTFEAFEGTEAQDKESTRNLVNSAFARCKAWTDPRAVRSLQSE